MKASLITIKGLYNYGAVLQAYATFKYLKNLGCEVEVIDYYPDYFENDTPILKKIAIQLLTSVKKYKFRKFSVREMNFTSKTYRNYKELLDENIKSDLFIVGSDQVWNSQLSSGKLDPAYFLEFTESKNKVAFSSSIGRTDVNANELKQMKEYLDKFSKIAVRESSAKEMLEDNGIKDVLNVLDPVFLLDKEDYKKFVKPVNYGKYLLIYSFDKNTSTEKTAKEIAKKLGLKVLEIGIFRSKYNPDKYIHNAGIEDFLSLMYHAEFVITSSFHGTAFSILLNKQFISVAPSVRKTRLENITNLLGIGERLITEKTDYKIDELIKPIDYEKVNKIVNLNAEKGRNFLKETVESIKL
jgi:hypothetical protein